LTTPFEKVESLLDGRSLAETLRQMREEAEGTESRCVALADRREGKTTAILEKSQETKDEATETRPRRWCGGLPRPSATLPLSAAVRSRGGEYEG